MKTKISRIGKKYLSLVIVMMMVVSMMLVGMVSASAASLPGGTVLYLNPTTNSDWCQYDTERYSMYVFNTSGNQWVSMTAVSGTSYYSATVPSGTWDGVIFCRMNNATTTNNWDNKWNQTNDLTYTSGKNLFSVGAQSGNYTGTWSTYSGGGGTDTPTDTTYYIGGRFKVKASADATDYTYTSSDSSTKWWTLMSTAIPFPEDSDKDGIYKLDTYCTFAELSAKIQNVEPYFLIHNGSTMYGGSSNHSVENATVNSPITLNTFTEDKTANYLLFGTSSSSTDKVTICLDTNDGMKLYCETTSSEPATPGEHNITTGTSENGTLMFTGSGNTTEGTANAGDTVTVSVTPEAGYLCTGITVSGGAAVTTINSNSYTFVMPDQDVTVSATYEAAPATKITKITNTSALWIDAAPTINGETSTDTSTLIKWNNFTGSKKEETALYTFYVPKNVELSNATIYNGFDTSVEINGITIPANGCATGSLVIGDYYSVNSKYVQVMQGSTDAMFIEQEKGDLPTTTKSGVVDETTAANYKKTVKVKGGTIITMSNDTDTPVFSDALAVDSIKGRGNSSWEASCRCFGKYAFNMKLVDATNLLGMDSAESTEGSKSWCLLANNADESMLRNAVAYQLAAEIGIDYPPEFRFVDIYDNNVYMGSYLITEKVDVGNKKLVKGKSIDDINEEAAIEAGLEEIDESTNTGTYTYNGASYPLKYATVCSVEGFAPNYTEGKFLLEFEIASRYNNEASWFQSPKGQYVVVKSPEFATYEEVEYIAKKFAEMEAKVYADGATLDTMDDYIDLESFAKMYLIQELSANLDSAATSYFVTYDCSKGTNARFIASPIWDYDWAFGQYGNSTKKNVRNEYLNPKATGEWYAKEKQMGDNQSTEYSLQSKLASSENYEPVIKYVWENSFYPAIQKFYGDNSYIDQWYTQISDSVDMNETRWGFIANNPIEGWGSSNTGATLEDTVDYLENTWITQRTTFLNGEITNYDGGYQPTTLATPTITTSLTTDTVEEGTEFTITATSTDSGVTFTLYDNGDVVETNSTTGIFTITAEEGEHSYTVETELGTVTSSASDEVAVTVTAKTTTELATPTITTSLTTDTVEEGTEFTITATTDDSGVTYVLYDNGTEVTSNTTGTFTITAVTGNHSYTVKTTSGDVTSSESNAVSVTVTAKVVDTTFSVELSADQTSFTTVGSTVNLTATIKNADSASTYTYEFYYSADNEISSDDTLLTSEGNTSSDVLESNGQYFYYVTVTDGTDTVTSEVIKVTVSQGSTEHKATIYFKAPSAYSYQPSVSLNGATPEKMVKSQELGKIFSGTLTIYWYSATITLDSTQENTLTFTTERTKVNASITDNFALDAYYLAVDDMMTGTEVVDLTASPEYIRNYYYSATHMVYAGDFEHKNTLGFTNVGGTRYKMGTYIDANGVSTLSIQSATLIQKLACESTTTSDLQEDLLDVNLDGTVDIRDATLVQKTLVNS